MVTHHDHSPLAPRSAAGEAGTAGDGLARSPAHDQGGEHGDHAMLAMLACCIAIGAAVLLIALGVF